MKYNIVLLHFISYELNIFSVISFFFFYGITKDFINLFLFCMALLIILFYYYYVTYIY